MKRKNKKRLGALLLAFLLLFALTACGGTADTKTDVPPSAAPSDSVQQPDVQGNNNQTDNNESTLFPLEIETVYYSTAYTGQDGAVSQTIEQAPAKILVLGAQAVDFFVYFGLEDLIYAVAGDDPVENTGLPESYYSILESFDVVNEGSSFLTAEQIYAAADAGVDMFVTTNPSLIRESGLSMAELNELGITYLYTFSCTFDGSYSLGSVSTISDVFNMYRDLGSLFGVSDQVDEYIQEQMAGFREVMNAIPDDAETPTVQFIYYGNSSAIYGDYSGCIIEEYVNMAGGKWVVPAGDGWPTSIEAEIELDPEIILMNANMAADMQFVEIEALQDMQAVKNGTVYVDNSLPWTSNTGHMFLADTLRLVASYIHPEIDF